MDAVEGLLWLMRACGCSGMSLVDLDGSRKSLEVVLISSIVMGVVGGGAPSMILSKPN